MGRNLSAEYLGPNVVEVLAGDTGVISKGQFGKTGELLGCRVVVLEEPSRCVVSHGGPLLNEQVLSQIEAKEVNPQSVIVYSLTYYDYIKGQSWRPVSWHDYHADRDELKASIQESFPDVRIEDREYDLRAEVLVDFRDDEPNVYVRLAE